MLSLPPGKEAIPGNIMGSAAFGRLKGDFHGLEEVKEEDNIKKNYWDIILLEWKGQQEGQAFGATKVVDDEGNPFIEFQAYLGYSGCVPHWSMYLLKKQQAAAVSERLTNSEKKRLGIGKSDEDVETLAKRESLPCIG